MKKVIVKLMKALAFCGAVVLFISCSEANEPVGKGRIEFELTDAPSDDANVKNVFVTVTDIKVDGISIGNVSKQTLDLKAYSAGNTKEVAAAEQFDAKTYKSVTLVLDLNEDADGMTPGSYVKMTNGKGYQLRRTADGKLELVILKEFTVENNLTTQLLIDFDLRKAIAYHANDPDTYTFVGDDELNRAIRMVEKKKTGTIQGIFSADMGLDDKVIVYAYKKGTFSASTETAPQGANQIYFINAAASADVSHSLNGRPFKLAYLEEGDYELYFVSYLESPFGRTSFKDVLIIETEVNGYANSKINVVAGGTVNISSAGSGTL